MTMTDPERAVPEEVAQWLSDLRKEAHHCAATKSYTKFLNLLCMMGVWLPDYGDEVELEVASNPIDEYISGDRGKAYRDRVQAIIRESFKAATLPGLIVAMRREAGLAKKNGQGKIYGRPEYAAATLRWLSAIAASP